MARARSEVLGDLAEFVYQLTNEETKYSLEQINLALANWVLDERIIIIAPEKETGDVDLPVQSTT